MAVPMLPLAWYYGHFPLPRRMIYVGRLTPIIITFLIVCVMFAAERSFLILFKKKKALRLSRTEIALESKT